MSLFVFWECKGQGIGYFSSVWLKKDTKRQQQNIPEQPLVFPVGETLAAQTLPMCFPDGNTLSVDALLFMV